MDFGREARLILYALQLLTRLPTPELGAPAPDSQARAAKYFPLVGILVGALVAMVLLLGRRVFGGAVPPLLAIGAGILLTGAFHEDGLADAADGLGGGSTPKRRLEIMKDSRIGTYGVIALVLVLALKAAALDQIAPPIAAAIIAAHAGGRAACVIVMARLRYAGDPDAAKLRPAAVTVTVPEMLIAIVIAVLPLLLMPATGALTGLALGGMAAAGVALSAKARIGGYTGDVLGAVEQVFEAGFLVGASILGGL
jgi:adenosylcobinamide-GDP ribazoletransferase